MESIAEEMTQGWRVGAELTRFPPSPGGLQVATAICKESVSTQEIIAELPKLSREELELVNSKVRELLSAPEPSQKSQLRKFAGAVRGLPRDMAANHIAGHSKCTTSGRIRRLQNVPPFGDENCSV